MDFSNSCYAEKCTKDIFNNCQNEYCDLALKDKLKSKQSSWNLFGVFSRNNNLDYLKKADYWSLGIILYRMIFLFHPYKKYMTDTNFYDEYFKYILSNSTSNVKNDNNYLELLKLHNENKKIINYYYDFAVKNNLCFAKYENLVTNDFKNRIIYKPKNPLPELLYNDFIKKMDDAKNTNIYSQDYNSLLDEQKLYFNHNSFQFDSDYYKYDPTGYKRENKNRMIS